VYFLRKITQGKWAKAWEMPGILPCDVDADTLTCDLRTDENKLSFWKVENDNDLDDAFIALASNMNSLGTIVAVKIKDDDFDKLSFNEELGETPTFNINQKHCNIINLTYGTFEIVITAILKAIRENYVIRKTKGEMKSLLIKAYEDKKLNTQKISERILLDIGVPLNK